MNDIERQIAYVVDGVERLLWQIDKDPLSPTYGCAHLAYWRDKTSDVADMRRQEGLLPLAMLFTGDYPGSHHKGDSRLLSAARALLSSG